MFRCCCFPANFRPPERSSGPAAIGVAFHPRCFGQRLFQAGFALLGSHPAARTDFDFSSGSDASADFARGDRSGYLSSSPGCAGRGFRLSGRIFPAPRTWVVSRPRADAALLSQAVGVDSCGPTSADNRWRWRDLFECNGGAGGFCCAHWNSGGGNASWERCA